MLHTPTSLTGNLPSELVNTYNAAPVQTGPLFQGLLAGTSPRFHFDPAIFRQRYEQTVLASRPPGSLATPRQTFPAPQEGALTMPSPQQASPRTTVATNNGSADGHSGSLLAPLQAPHSPSTVADAPVASLTTAGDATPSSEPFLGLQPTPQEQQQQQQRPTLPPPVPQGSSSSPSMLAPTDSIPLALPLHHHHQHDLAYAPAPAPAPPLSALDGAHVQQPQQQQQQQQQQRPTVGQEAHGHPAIVTPPKPRASLKELFLAWKDNIFLHVVLSWLLAMVLLAWIQPPFVTRVEGVSAEQGSGGNEDHMALRERPVSIWKIFVTSCVFALALGLFATAYNVHRWWRCRKQPNMPTSTGPTTSAASKANLHGLLSTTTTTSSVAPNKEDKHRSGLGGGTGNKLPHQYHHSHLHRSHQQQQHHHSSSGRKF